MARWLVIGIGNQGTFGHRRAHQNAPRHDALRRAVRAQLRFTGQAADGRHVDNQLLDCRRWS